VARHPGNVGQQARQRLGLGVRQIEHAVAQEMLASPHDQIVKEAHFGEPLLRARAGRRLEGEWQLLRRGGAAAQREQSQRVAAAGGEVK
jgi:hypothetical protein